MHRFATFPRLSIRRLVVPAALLLLAGCGGGGGGSAGSAGNGWSISATATALPGTNAPMTGGQVAGTGTYPDGATVTLSAVPAPGFAFVGWEENSATVATTPRYSFTAQADRHLTARFVVRHPFVDRMIERLDTSTIAAADFDGDGHADDLLADRVWVNNGRGGFRAAFMIPYQPGMIMIPVDADGDGDDDVLTLEPYAMLYRNDGTGRMQPVADAFGTTPPRTGAAIPVAGDLDGDGDPDLVMATGPGVADVWLNDGKGHFSPALDLGALDGAGGTRFLLADLDRDGDLDLVSVGVGYIRPVSIWFNDGRGGFTASTQAPSITGNIARVAAGDVDGDGYSDLIFGLQDDSAQLWINNRNGAFFAASPSTPLPRGDGGLALGDLDGDGDLDLVIGNPVAGGYNQIWRNDGTRGFRTRQALEADITRDLILADLDRDGDLDIAVANGCSGYGCSSPSRNRIWLNDGAGRFHEPVVSISSRNDIGLSIATGDIDGDGDADLVTGGSTFSVIWHNSGQGALWYAINTGRSDGGLALGDIDGDGDPDLALGVQSPTDASAIIVNHGAAGFTIGQSLSAADTQNMIFADADGDGDLDLLEITGSAANNQPSKLNTWINDGQGRFSLKTSLTLSGTYDTGAGPQRAVTADVDGDGDVDVITVDSSGTAVFLAKNVGDGRFVSEQRYLPSPSQSAEPVCVRIADFDGDGTPDLTTGYPNGGGARIWLNNGNGRFTDSGQQLGGGNIAALVAGDLDGDGDPDLVTIPGNGSPMHAWVNDGTASFHDAGEIRVPDTDSATTINDALLIDLDGDGAPELVTVGQLNTATTGARIYPNTVVP